MQNTTDRHLSLADIEAGLARRGGSPQDNGRLDMIVCRPDIGERLALDSAELHLDEGLVGDTWFDRGSGSTLDGGPKPEAQVTLMNSRVVDVLAGDRTRWALAGDQLYVDLDLGQDNLPPGQRIAIGGAVLEITATPHTGCLKFSQRYGSAATQFVNSPEGMKHRRRGVNARVVQPGPVRVGDVVVKVSG